MHLLMFLLLIAVLGAVIRFRLVIGGLITNTDRTQITAEVNNFYDTVLLMQALPLNVHGLFAQLRRVPPNIGSAVIKFRRYTILSAATTAISDGVTPTGSTLAVTDITATLLQYGDWVQITDIVATQTPDAILTDASEQLGIQQGITNDQLTRNILVAGSVVQYAGGAVSRLTVAAGMLISLVEIKKSTRTLKNANARKLTSISPASPGIGTVPVNAAYFGICSPGTEYDIRAIPGFISVEKYAPNAALVPGEFGMVEQVRFTSTTNAKVFTGGGAGAIDVHATLIFGSNAYGIVDLGNSQASGVIFHGFGSGGVADPLNQLQTLGWKEFYIAKILNDNFMVRVEHAISA